MSSQEILKRAISKAIDGGWDVFGEGWVLNGIERNDNQYTFNDAVRYQNCAYFRQADDSEPYWVQAVPLYEIIFDKDFARALWGKEPKSLYADSANEDYLYETLPIWQYHLQQMVISGDPIKYLGENI